MRLVLVAVGKLRPALRETCDDYLRRLRRFLTIDEHEVREPGGTGDAMTRRRTEGERVLAFVRADNHLVLLDRNGEGWSSERLAAELQGWRTEARDCVLIIGGADGVDDAVRARANQCWSLGPPTLPHELCRVIVVEQLYRAASILQGQPYHRGSR